jgi:hypothetical protein
VAIVGEVSSSSNVDFSMLSDELKKKKTLLDLFENQHSQISTCYQLISLVNWFFSLWVKEKEI